MGIYIKNQQKAIDLDLKWLAKRLTRAMLHLRLQRTELSVLFVNGRRMRALNTRYRGIPKDTDVLSFPLTDEGLHSGPVLLGDIVVSVPRALKQAREFKVPFHDELLRLLVHGLLHLVGYDHETNPYQKKKMEKKSRSFSVPLRKWLNSTNFAIEGILHGAKTQRHLRYHFFSAAFVLFLSYILGVTRTEFVLISLAVMLVITAEMLNSAVEVVVDILSPEYSEKARVAKDIAAGAVLISSFGAAVLGYIVIFPYLKTLFTDGFSIARHSKEDITLIAVILVMILVIITKSYFGKGHPLSGGMPSGHSALAFSAWVSVTYLTGNFLVSLLCLMLSVWIAQSRVAVKAHNPWEVLLGALMGAAVTFLLFSLFS